MYISTISTPFYSHTKPDCQDLNSVVLACDTWRLVSLQFKMCFRLRCILLQSSVIELRETDYYPIEPKLNLIFFVFEVEIVSENVKTEKVTFCLVLMKKYADCSPAFI